MKKFISFFAIVLLFLVPIAVSAQPAFSDSVSISEMSFWYPQVTLTVGEQQALRLVIQPIYADIHNDITWESSNERVVTVSQYGVVSGLSRGSAIITARTANSNTMETSCTVTVARDPYAPLEEITPARYTQAWEHGILQRTLENRTDAATLMLTGDLMCLSSQQGAARAGGTFNFNSSFSLVKDVFAQADFVVGNLETMLSCSSPYTSERKEIGGNPHCNAPSTFADALRYAGFDAVVTANNHCCDAGPNGIYETLQLLDKYGLAHTGTFDNAYARRFLLADVNGIRVAILSYTGHFNNKQGKLSEMERTIMLNEFSEERVQADVADARAAGAEFVIAYQHWGTENIHSVNSRQIAQAQMMADAGVDLIAGSHPHCLQRAEYLTAQDGRQVLCVYSLGNFVSGMPRTINNDTIILQIELERTTDGTITLAAAGYIPCRVFPSLNAGHHVIVPVDEALNGGLSNNILASAQDRIEIVMGDQLSGL